MGMSFIDSRKVYMSLISSYNLYMDTGQRFDTISSGNAVQIKHINTGEEFYCVKISNMGYNQTPEIWKRIIFRPANNSFFWPIDIIDMISEDNGDREYYLVYPFRFVPEVKPLAELVKTEGFLGVEQSSTRLIIKNFLEAFITFYECSYLYNVWDESHLFINTKDNSILISFNDAMTVNERNAVCIDSKVFFSEYTDPYAYANGSLYDEKSECFAVASILFFLLIGRYPYEGSLMDGVPKDSESEIEYWKKNYLSHPIFIFDTNDKRNAIGDFSDEKIFLNRWQSLSDELKEMFAAFFCESNIMRTTENSVSYSLFDWKKAIDNYFC